MTIDNGIIFRELREKDRLNNPELNKHYAIDLANNLDRDALFIPYPELDPQVIPYLQRRSNRIVDKNTSDHRKIVAWIIGVTRSRFNNKHTVELLKFYKEYLIDLKEEELIAKIDLRIRFIEEKGYDFDLYEKALEVLNMER